MEKTVNQYQIIEKCGDKLRPVYLARDPDNGLVILKRNNPSHFTGLRGISEEEAIRTSIRSLEHEREILDRLYTQEKIGICEVLDWIEGRDYAYIVMNHIPGNDLNIIKNAPIGTKLKAIRDVARTLQYSHSRGIIHRDVSPFNIKIDPDLNTTLLDWSIAYDSKRDKWNPYTFSGTADFMSPQQAAGFEPNPSQDVYSLSLVALELLTKRPVNSFKWNDNGKLVYPKKRVNQIPEDLISGCNQKEEERPCLEKILSSLN